MGTAHRGSALPNGGTPGAHAASDCPRIKAREPGSIEGLWGAVHSPARAGGVEHAARPTYVSSALSRTFTRSTDGFMYRGLSLMDIPRFPLHVNIPAEDGWIISGRKDESPPPGRTCPRLAAWTSRITEGPRAEIEPPQAHPRGRGERGDSRGAWVSTDICQPL